MTKSRDSIKDIWGDRTPFYETWSERVDERTGKAGLVTAHMDGNTRLCTATAGQALKETFGTEGQPASYTDFDTTEAILHVGHNVAEAQTVLWSRILDRRRGPKPPKLVVIDPRATPTAKEADAQLAPVLGTNVAVLNGLLNLIIENGKPDTGFINNHTVGFEFLRDTVSLWPPERGQRDRVANQNALRGFGFDRPGTLNSKHQEGSAHSSPHGQSRIVPRQRALFT